MRIHAPYKIKHEPLLGSYAVRTLEGLQGAKRLGMNVVIGTDEMLDTDSPTGGFLHDSGIKLLHHMTRFIYGMPTLGDTIEPEQVEIPLSTREARELGAPGIIQIEDELIRYEEAGPDGLLGCERGWGETEAAEHNEGIILFDPEDCAKEVARSRGSPNLYGYYVLDDSPGDALSALRAMYRIIWDHDGGKDHHPVFAGYGSKGSLCNFAPGTCDAMMIYWYPVDRNGYNRLMISSEVQWLMMEARKRVPGIPFLGVYQAFWGDGALEPTPEQVREQAEDFVREGASGLIAFAGEIGDPYGGWMKSEPMQREMSSIHDEIRRTGGLGVRPETAEMSAARIQPVGFWDSPREVSGIVPSWQVVGPFDDKEKKLLDAEFPPDWELDLEATYEGKFGPAHWIRRESVSGSIGLGEIYGVQSMTAYCTAYATCSVESPDEREVLIKAGSDDDILIKLDGEEVFRHDGTRGLKRDDDTVQVALSPEAARLMLKVCNRTGMWGFCLRFTDLGGRPAGSLRFSL